MGIKSSNVALMCMCVSLSHFVGVCACFHLFLHHPTPPSLAVPAVMHGFGDDETPYAESVAVLNDMVKEYIDGMVRLVLLSLSVCQSVSVHVFVFLCWVCTTW